MAEEHLPTAAVFAGLACARAGFAVAWIWGWHVAQAMDPEA
ncbi:hypothetical protein EKPJFOCH_1750 [Methylobacterium thuringiense]|uniref:MFS transporter n=1 Tax=Methylobacterium thuringiense TaxID=1003091 RepID=A0ABQ4TJ02_9HYPH|nr:hypothetical protein EKPJFOCH_1750 [Methylobacterium thuringiense]